jgi:hypothetical protein
MDYIRFSRSYFDAISRVCGPLGPNAFPPHKREVPFVIRFSRAHNPAVACRRSRP